MAQHSRDMEKATNEEKILQHSSTCKSSSVINQLKTKVKRKTKTTTLDLSDSGSNLSLNNINNHRKSPERLELTRHQPIALETIFSYDGTEPDRNSNQEVENEEKGAFTVIPTIEKQDLEQPVQWRNKPVNDETNTKICSTKIKVVQLTRTFPETNHLSNPKKRRQTVRRTGFQIRDEDFRTIFSDLPSDEQLVIGYPAAWRKDVFMHGRMFLTMHYLCFYTCFFKWEESLCIALRDIVSITREKSAKLLPNAIRVRTKNRERYFFASTLPRERIFITIFRIWQNALIEQPLDYQQLRAVVSADQQSLDESSEDSEESVNLGNSTTAADLHSQSLPVIARRSVEPTRQHITVDRRVISLPADNEHGNYLSSCGCETHLTKTYADRLFTLSVDTLFELLFSDNSFTRSFHNAQKLTDYNYGEWRLSKQTGHRERQVTYNTITQSILGTNALSCREKQTLEVEKPKLIYVLSSEVYNEGMKYTDAFYVATKFCMTQRDAGHSSLRATVEVRYTKSVNGFIRTFIEKNAYASIEEGVNEQVRRLEAQQVNRRSHEKLSSALKSNREESRSGDEITPRNPANAIAFTNSNISVRERTITGKGVFYDTALMIGISLLLLHIYLCYKLYSFDQSIPKLDTICFNQCFQTCQNSKISSSTKNN